MKNPITNIYVTRWLLLLQEFDITIIDKPGKENAATYFLSLLPIEGDPEPIEDSFPKEHLFTMSTHGPWYANIVNYLVVGKIPTHLSARECRHIIRQSVRYSCIDGYLFYIRLDLLIKQSV